MGKKSSSAPAVPAEVGIAMQKQAEIAEQQQKWYETEVYPWYKESTEKQNALQEQLVNSSMEDAEWWRNYTQEQTDKANAIRDEYYDHWKNDYKPIEDQLISDAQKFNSDAYAEQQAQMAIGDVAAQYANQKQQTALNMSKYGIDPSSGQFMGQMNALSINQSAATAAASNAARQAAVQLGWDKNLQLANLGVQYAGITNNATSGVNQTAGTGQNGVNSSMGVASNASTQQLSNISGLAQTGLQSYQALSNAWGNYGNLANQTYQNQLSAWQAQQQANASSSAGIGSLVGSVATTAAVAF
ncbi:hypothetical protein [uncultured Parasutterella sp.]|uniref:hypothetical protein n=1 Tax=uncultured Parasutterella sp. TaxID=1263098 RepID=UPI0025916738|nr:hypothetical protein [uncultured Parasutterella sp.]